MKTRERMRQGALLALLAIGFIAFCTLGSEDAPGREMSLGYFIRSKSAAVAVLICCVAAIRAMKRKGLVPPPEDNSKKWEE